MAEEAPAPEGGETEGGEAKSGGKKKLILILAPVLIILIAAGAFFMMGGKKEDAPAPEHAQGEAHEESVEEFTVDEHGNRVPKKIAFYDLPEILVNLTSSANKRNFLKISISLEVEDETKVPEIRTLEPRIVDKFQVYLRGLTVDDLQGSDAVYRLREELLNRVNTTIKPMKVNQVLFKEILVQ